MGYKKVRLVRAFESDVVCLGMLQIVGLPHAPIYTLENPDLGEEISGSGGRIKAGTYKCKHFNGTQFKDVYEITGVTGRSHILIHQGNTTKDSIGCVLVGMGAADFNGAPGVTNSVNAMNYLRKLLRKEDFEIEITGTPRD